jgi:hypothetical protein
MKLKIAAAVAAGVVASVVSLTSAAAVELWGISGYADAAVPSDGHTRRSYNQTSYSDEYGTAPSLDPLFGSAFASYTGDHFTVSQHATASAYSSLYSGALGVSATSSRNCTTFESGDSICGFSSAAAEAQLHDTVFLDLGDADPAGSTLVGLKIRVDGNVSEADSTAVFIATVLNSYTNAFVVAQYQNGALSSDHTGWFRSDWAAVDRNLFLGTMFFEVPNSEASFPIRMSLAAGGVEGGFADLSHTAQLELILPEGVGYRTASGGALSAAGVPEPTSWLLMILGFGGAGAALRRRRGLAIVA